MTAEILNVIDGYSLGTDSEDLQHQVDRFCVGIEDLISEWSLSSTMMDDSKSELLRSLTADHVSARQITRRCTWDLC
jgi:hypothetical protein